jgi:hypothetical protein
LARMPEIASVLPSQGWPCYADWGRTIVTGASEYRDRGRTIVAGAGLANHQLAALE